MHLRIKPGFELSYRVSGDGPPLLMLPGILGNHEAFAPLVEALSAAHRCITVEFAGQGETVIDALGASEDYAIERHAEAVSALVTHLGLERFHLLGLSFGSVVACRLARQYAERVERLVLLGALLCNDTRHYRNWNALWARCSEDSEAFARITTGLVYSEGFWQRYPRLLEQARERLDAIPEAQRRAFRWNLAAVAAYPVADDYAALGQPVCCIHGVEDLIHPVDELRARVRPRPGSELVELPGVGHGLHVEAPDEVARSVLAFLAPADGT